MGADFPMTPHESTLFSSVCKTKSLGIVPYQVTVKASTPRHPGVCPGSWLHKGCQEGMAWSKTIDFYVLSWGVPALHQKSGQKSDSVVNMDFLASLKGLFEAKKLHFAYKKRR
jgi:hypothetical protein